MLEKRNIRISQLNFDGVYPSAHLRFDVHEGEVRLGSHGLDLSLEWLPPEHRKALDDLLAHIIEDVSNIQAKQETKRKRIEAEMQARIHVMQGRVAGNG